MIVNNVRVFHIGCSISYWSY